MPPQEIPVINAIQKDVPVYDELVGQIYGLKDIPIIEDAELQASMFAWPHKASSLQQFCTIAGIHLWKTALDWEDLEL